MQTRWIAARTITFGILSSLLGLGLVFGGLNPAQAETAVLSAPHPGSTLLPASLPVPSALPSAAPSLAAPVAPIGVQTITPLASPSPVPPPKHSRGDLEKIEKGKLIFTGYDPIQTSWEHIDYLGQISVPENSKTAIPYAVLVAKPCHDCIEETSIQMIRLDGNKLLRFAQPGRIRDPKTGETLVDSRSFFGLCLPGEDSTFVSFQKDLIERKRWKKRRKSIEPSFLIAQPQADGTVREKLNELRSIGQLAAKERQTLLAVKQKKCFEVPPRDRRITAKLIRLRPDQQEEDDADDEDEATDPASTKVLPGAPDAPAEPNPAELGIPTLSAPAPAASPSAHR